MSDANLVITVDRERCMGSGVCTFHAPNTFDIDDECKSVVIGVHDTDSAIRTAAESCPQRAITISHEEN